METKDRSKQAQQIITDRLSQYFTEEQLSYLDDMSIEVLNDYFSNAELRDLKEATPAVLKAFIDRNNGNEVKRRLTHITEDEYESGDLLDWYKDNCTDIEEVVDTITGAVIALEVKHKTLKNSTKVHWDGRFIIAIGDRLASTRTRLDGVIGYQSALQVQNPEFVEQWSAFYEEREKKLAAYRKRVDKAKSDHRAAFEEAEKVFNQEVERYNGEFIIYESYLVSIQGSKDNIKNDVVDKPVYPVFEQPEYFSPGEFIEPERPNIPQFLPPLDTRWADVETEVIPEDHVMSSISNSDILNVKRHIESTGYKKPVTKVKGGYKVDQFILRKVQ